MVVKKVNSLAEFKKELVDAGDRLVVVDFTAAWCGPCKQMSPIFEEQSKLPDNANVVFLKVDVDEADEVSTDCGIQCMPTFHFYKKGEKVTDFSGANKQLLLQKIKELK